MGERTGNNHAGDRQLESLGLGQIGQLLGLATEHELPDDEMLMEQLMKEGLSNRLAGTIPPGTAISAQLPALLGRLRGHPDPLPGRNLGMAVLDPNTSVELLTGIKRCLKEEARYYEGMEGRHPEYAAALTAYYLVIASALRFHGRKITRHSFQDLAQWFRVLGTKSWMPEELRSHFTVAAGLCGTKANGRQEGSGDSASG